MTNAELLAKIKAEIEKQIKDPQEHCYGVSSVNKLRELLDFLDTLESEKPMNQEGLEKEIDKTINECTNGYEFDWDKFARHFAQWGYLRAAEKYNEIEYNRQRAEESVPNDLEEAAEKHSTDYDSTIWYVLESSNQKTIWERELKETFIAGAKWQEEHTPLPEDTVLFNKGVAEGKRLMMEELSEHIAVAYQLGMATHNPNIEPKIELIHTTDTTPVDGKELLYVSDKSYKIGWRDCKEQMLKDAVEGMFQNTPFPTICLDDCKDYNFKDDQKVRIIVLPNTDEK